MKMILVGILLLVSVPLTLGQEDTKENAAPPPPIAQEIEFPPGAAVVIQGDAGAPNANVFVWQRGNEFQLLGGDEFGKKKRDELSKHIAIKLAGFRRACQVDDVQFKKLELISKGVIDRHMEKIDEYQKSNKHLLEDDVFGNLAAGLVINNVAAFVDVADVADEAANIDQADEAKDEASDEVVQIDEDPVDLEGVVVDFAAGFPAPMVPGGAIQWDMQDGRGLASVAALNAEEVMEKDPVWQKAIAKILTPQQVAAYEASERKRRAFKVRAVVTDLILKFDETLLFSDEQRDSLETLLIDEMTSKDGDRSTEILRALVASVALELRPSVLKSILDDAQIASWNDCTKSQTRTNQLGRFQLNQLPAQRLMLPAGGN